MMEFGYECQFLFNRWWLKKHWIEKWNYMGLRTIYLFGHRMYLRSLNKYFWITGISNCLFIAYLKLVVKMLSTVFSLALHKREIQCPIRYSDNWQTQWHFHTVCKLIFLKSLKTMTDFSEVCYITRRSQ